MPSRTPECGCAEHGFLFRESISCNRCRPHERAAHAPGYMRACYACETGPCRCTDGRPRCVSYACIFGPYPDLDH